MNGTKRGDEPGNAPVSPVSINVKTPAILSGAVGIRVGKGGPVANKAADQKIVIALLAAIADRCGGKNDTWKAPPSPGPDGTCPKAVADALLDFQKTWAAKGLKIKPDGVADPGGATIRQLHALTHGRCGPKVDTQFRNILTRIQSDFRSWPASTQDAVCSRILIPVVPSNKATPSFGDLASDPTKLLQLAGYEPDINGWDVLPLFWGTSQWLRSPKLLNKGCGVPTSAKPKAPADDPAHEDPCTCSDSVEIGGQCWLNGTVNYGTFGIMIGLCADAFLPALLRGVVLTYATQILIRGYKALINKEDPTLPIAWVRATFENGPAGVPRIASNRPNCACGCSLDGSIVKWDYVWEPKKTRQKAKLPHL